MTQVSYELRPLDADRTLMKFTDRTAAVNWATQRNSNPLQRKVRLVEVVTKITEKEIKVAA